MNTSREFTTFYSANDMTMLNNYSTYQNDKNSEPTIDEVMEDFQNIINDVQNQNYRNEQKNKDQYEDVVIRRFQNADGTSNSESLTEVAVFNEEKDIVPSLILPEPPKKTRSLHLLNKTNIEMNPFFEDESVVDTNFVNFNRISAGNFQPNTDKYPARGYAYERSIVDNSQPTTIRPGLRRSETFLHLQPNDRANNSTSQKYVLDSRVVPKSRRSPSDKVKMLNVKNSNYVLQNSNNLQKELFRNKDEHTKLARSVSTKPLTNGAMPSVKCAPFPRINPVAYFPKKNVFPGHPNPQQFSLKRHQNAGLYSDTNHAPPPTGNNLLHQVITITSEYPKRSLNGLKHINLNICEGKLMDLPSGLY